MTQEQLSEGNALSIEIQLAEDRLIQLTQMNENKDSKNIYLSNKECGSRKIYLSKTEEKHIMDMMLKNAVSRLTSLKKQFKAL